MHDSNALGAAAAIGSAAAWAVGAYLFKSLGEILTPLAMTLAKGVCSLFLLGFAMAIMGCPPMDWHSVCFLSVSGLLGIALGDTLFFRALQGLKPFHLLVLAVLGQVLTVVLAVIFLEEPLTLAAVIGILCVVAGVTIVLRGPASNRPTIGDDGRNEEPSPTIGRAETRARTLGVIFGLLSVTCMATSSVIAKKGLGDESFTIQATFIRMLAGTVGVFLYGAGTKQVSGWFKPFRESKLIGKFVGAVTVVTFGGFWLGMVSFKYTSVAIASTLTSTEPVFGLIIAAIVFGERIRRFAVVGTAITLLGVVLLSMPQDGKIVSDSIDKIVPNLID
jgi:drug/metabolite transporter (DMT)-like permease